jgi:hypothetical protein
MTRRELERQCRQLGYEPSADDTDDDLRIVLLTWARRVPLLAAA